MDTIENLVKKLSNDALFQISLSSKELFHSNFLAWLFESYPEIVSSVFDIPYVKEVKVSREKLNIDLTIFEGDDKKSPLVIIENKVKDVITSDQLERYDEKIKNEYKNASNVKKILLSLAKVDKDHISNTWEIISYQQLSKKLNSIFSSNFAYKEASHKTYIQDYINLVKNIADLFELVLEENNKKYWFFNAYKKHLETLQKIRFHDVYIKYLASTLEQDIQTVKSDCSNIQVSSRFSRGKPCVYVTIEKTKELKLGIQIEGSQYRRNIQDATLKIPRGNTLPKHDYERIKKHIKNHGIMQNWLYDDNFIVDNSTSSMKAGQSFRKYYPDFIYRYQDIKNDGHPDEILEKIINDINYALSL